MLRRIESGQFTAVTHVEMLICLDVLGPGGFADPNSPHPAFTLAGVAIADFPAPPSITVAIFASALDGLALRRGVAAHG
jgi:hypothetical protein